MSYLNVFTEYKNCKTSCLYNSDIITKIYDTLKKKR